MPRLLIVDHPPTRRGIRIAADGRAEVCAEAGNGAEAIAAAERTQPDICIIRMGITDRSIDTIERICQVAPGTRVVVISGAPDAHELLAAVRVGAIGYLPGSIEREALGRVVAAVAAGEAAVPRSMVLDLARELQRSARAADLLTSREAEVLELLREGESTAAIAAQLSISPITVRRHISTLMHKLGATSREALVAGQDPAASERQPGPLGAFA